MSESLYLNALWNPAYAICPPPDLTGTNSQYYHSDDQYAAYITGAQIFFDQTLYQQGLVFTPSGGSAWVYGTDWTVTDADVDTDTMTKAATLLPGFTLPLLKSVTVLHTQASLPLMLTVASQSFYPRPENIPPLPGADNALTALLEYMMARLNEIQSQVTRVTATTSGGSLTPALLAYDINETISANLITAEPYTVNTYTGQSTIRPIQGSFFKDSLVLTAAGTTLVAGRDYQAVGLNTAKTKQTVNPNGIYDAILLTYDYAGTVAVTYHAIGGVATVADLNAVYQTLVDMKNFLDTGGFVTQDQLVTTPAIQNILNKLCATENQVRVLLTGTPNYGDSTNGVTVVKSLRAPDTGLHWYTIGSLYQVLGSTDIAKTDRMSLHIQLVNALLTADVGITFDLRQAQNTLTVNASNVTQDVEFVLYGSAGTPANVVMPQFRVIWNAPATYVSGALLQIGLNLPNLTDTLAIEDRSGVESCWLLNTTTGSSGSPLSPQDTTIVLPDGVSVWTTGSGTSTSATKMMPNEAGYLVWAGSQAITTFDTTIGKVTLANVLQPGFLIQDIREIVCEFEDASTNVQRVVVPMTGLTNTARRGLGMVYIGTASPVPLEVDLTLSGGVITLQVEIQANVQASPVTTLKYVVAQLRHGLV